MSRWWQVAAAVDADDQAFLVVEAKLHDPSAWKLRVLEQLSVHVSEAMRELLDAVRSGLEVTMEEDDPSKLACAMLRFVVTSEHAGNIRRLLAQQKFDTKTGARLPFTNAYRFVECRPDTGERFIASSCLAQGAWKERTTKHGMVRTHHLSLIDAKTGMQRLLQTYVSGSRLRELPRALRDGVCQEVAQQVTSFLGQLEHATAGAKVSFPTVESRDPVGRRAVYEAAIDRLVGDLDPFCYAKLRDKFPGDFAADDPRGDRRIVDDERWFAVTRTPNPHPIPMFFVNGTAVTILKGSARFDAGVSRRKRHRGALTPDSKIFAARPEGVQRKGRTYVRQWYAALPVLDTDDASVRETVALRSSHGGTGRGLDLGLHSVPLMGKSRWRRHAREMLVMLSGNRGRFERLLKRRDLQIACSRLVMKRGDWFLQLTLRIPIAQPQATGRVLGVSFGIEAVATWSLIEHGKEIETGAMSPNPTILRFLERKREVEGEQRRGRWVGGQAFDHELASVAHTVANDLVELARAKQAALALEDVQYVQKSGPDHERNVIFTVWNYGQLRTYTGYKSGLAGLGEAIFTSDYVVAFTCPSCGAIRQKGAKLENAVTWRENGTLYCRRCKAETVLTSALRARRVALHAESVLLERAKRKAAREAAL